MTAIPPPSDSTVQRIFKSWEDKEKPRFSRRLGASQIGRPCDREKWYSFRWAKLSSFNGRMLRLFSKGYIEETALGEDLKRIGVNFLAVDSETEKQFEFSELNDHFVCKLDGAAIGFVEAPETWHVIEFKTANHKAFELLEKEGLQKAKPEHYAQVQTGMGMSGMERAAYLAVNKDTEDIYMERVRFDKKEWRRILAQAESIIYNNEPPERLGGPAFWQCKFCNFHGICHESGECAIRNCRTCQFSQPLSDESCPGGWGCNRNLDCITEDLMAIGCDCHRYLPGMAPEAVLNVQQTLGAKVIATEGTEPKKLTLSEDNLSV